jgi:phosphoribosylglycinamide formyltransferase 1
MKHTNPINIAILASGSGTNAERIIQHFTKHDTIRVSLVISNKPDAYVLERANRLNIPSDVIVPSQWKDDQFVLATMDKYKIDFLVLAGYLLLIPSWLVSKYTGRIINIHPSLLPKFGGKGMYGDHIHKAVIASGEVKSGITIHHVNDHYDQGDIIFQAECPVFPTDTPETLATKIHTLEYEHFPKVIERVIMESIIS